MVPNIRASSRSFVKLSKWIVVSLLFFYSCVSFLNLDLVPEMLHLVGFGPSFQVKSFGEWLRHQHTSFLPFANLLHEPSESSSEPLTKYTALRSSWQSPMAERNLVRPHWEVCQNEFSGDYPPLVLPHQQSPFPGPSKLCKFCFHPIFHLEGSQTQTWGERGHVWWRPERRCSPHSLAHRRPSSVFSLHPLSDQADQSWTPRSQGGEEDLLWLKMRICSTHLYFNFLDKDVNIKWL